MTKKIKVIIADDHDIYVDGLERNLNGTNDIEVLASATNGKILIDLVHQYQPDVVLTDIIMPIMNGVEAIVEIQKFRKDIKCLALSTFDNNYLVLDAVEAGAKGYILKGVPKGEVIDAVRAVHEGDFYYCSQTTNSLQRILKKSSFNPYSSIADPDLFTVLEKQIIHYICEEKTSEEIADILYIGVRSVEKHRSKILLKMKVRHSVGIGIYAVKNKLYPAPEHIIGNR